jgi:hypothetical protein
MGKGRRLVAAISLKLPLLDPQVARDSHPSRAPASPLGTHSGSSTCDLAEFSA